MSGIIGGARSKSGVAGQLGQLHVTGEFSGTTNGVAHFKNSHASVGSGDEVMRVQFSGDNDATGGHMINFYDSGGDIGRINVASASTVAYSTTSDYRLKENVIDIVDPITKLKSLKPKTYNFIKTPDIAQDGFLAHELAEVCPIAVSGEKDEVLKNADGSNKLDFEGNTIPYYQSVDSGKIIPLLTRALQESVTKIEALETEMIALKKRIETLENE